MFEWDDVAAVLLAVFVGIPMLALALVGMAIYHGFVLYILWGWFVVPLGVTAISIPWAIGLSVLVGAFHEPPPVETEQSKISTVLSLLRPLLLLGVGWIVHQYM